MKYLKRAALALAGLLVALLCWGVAIEPSLIDREEETAPIPDLPAAWEGQRVALIADLHVDMWLANTDTVRRVVDELVEERPAAVLIAGDFVYQPGPDAGEELREVADLLRPLPAAGVPTYAVLGNHDHGLNDFTDPPDPGVVRPAQVRATLAGIGVRVLDNEAVPLPTPGGAAAPGPPLYLVGIDSAWAEAARPLFALNQVPRGAPRLVLMHNPDTFERLPAGEAPLAVAGHTHGGQVRIPFLPEWSWLTFAEPDPVHADGWIDGYGAPGNRLYVNRGIGFGTAPIRINCPPELTIFTLRAAGMGSPGTDAGRP